MLIGSGRKAQVKVRLEFKLEDFWVGVFWRVVPARIEIWICFLPCLPIHIIIRKKLTFSKRLAYRSFVDEMIRKGVLK